MNANGWSKGLIKGDVREGCLGRLSMGLIVQEMLAMLATTGPR